MLPKAFVEARFAFHGKVLNGTPQLAERWKRGIAATSAALPEAVGQLYVAALLPAGNQGADAGDGEEPDRRLRRPHRSPRVDVAGHQGQARSRSSRRCGVGVGYPDTWTDYRACRSSRATRSATASGPSCFEYQRHLAKLGAPVDKGEWWMSPQTVNARQPAAAERAELSGRHPRAAVVRSRPRRPRPTTAPSAPSSATRSRTASTIRARCSTPTAAWPTGGRRRTSQHFQAAGAQLAAQYDAYMPFPDLAPERPADVEREHRRRGRAGHCLRRLARVARRHGADARDGRLHRRPAVLPGLRARAG